jgi:hypothetical protein
VRPTRAEGRTEAEPVRALGAGFGGRGLRDDRAKKRKPIREESFPAESVFQANDFSYVDSIVYPNRGHRAGPKGYPPSAMFAALLLMYLREIRSILDLVRFLKNNPEWLRILGLKRRVGGSRSTRCRTGRASTGSPGGQGPTG